MERYTVFKSTGTHSEVIAAVGAADVLRELEPQLVNCGDRFEVQLRSPAVPDDLAGTDPGFLYLPKSEKPPDVPYFSLPVVIWKAPVFCLHTTVL
jgi:hypothetical protein